MGKTSLVKRLQAEARRWENAVDLPISFDDASAPTTSSQAFDALVQVVESLGARLFSGGGRDSGVFGEFANDLSRAEQERALITIDADVKVDAGHATITDADVAVVDAKVEAGELEGVLLGEKFRLVASAFVSRYKPLVKRRSALVTVDGWDSIAGTEFSRWLMSLLVQLPNTLVVLTRSPGAVPPGAAGALLERAELGPFSRAEIGELVQSYLSGRGIDPRLVEIVHAWSDGHPFTADLAAKYLSTCDDLDPDAFTARLAELPRAYGEQRIKIALESVRAPGADCLADAARALAITRRFDADLLGALVDEGTLPFSAEDAIDRLRRACIVEPVAGGSYRVRSFIREPLEEELAPARRRVLHRRAADHYYAILCADEPELDASARAYEQWYRYERPEWQSQLREWLYHTRGAATTEQERRHARLEFARVFLDAFWWWGCYLDFPFCRDLIADWRRARDDDSEWLTDLELLLRAYPKGYRKEGDKCWRDVRAALLGVRSECGLDGAPDALEGSDARHTRGLLDNFLAHSCRYRPAATDGDRAKAYEQALGYYEEAARLFETENESWELAWTLFETAELHVDNGALTVGREVWRRAVERALDEDDWELKANLHRLAGDIHWREGATAAAFDAHARAVLHAYLFQCQTASHRPDLYTVAFYREQVERVFERLKGADGRALADAVARLAAPFGEDPPAADAVAAVLAADQPGGLAGLLFPDAPKDEELREGSSAFTRRVRLLAEDLGGAPEQDLAEVEL